MNIQHLNLHYILSCIYKSHPNIPVDITFVYGHYPDRNKINLPLCSIQFFNSELNYWHYYNIVLDERDIDPENFKTHFLFQKIGLMYYRFKFENKSITPFVSEFFHGNLSYKICHINYIKTLSPIEDLLNQQTFTIYGYPFPLDFKFIYTINGENNLRNMANGILQVIIR